MYKSLACTKLDDLKRHFQCVRGYIRHAVLDADLLSRVVVQTAENLGGLPTVETSNLLSVVARSRLKIELRHVIIWEVNAH